MTHFTVGTRTFLLAAAAAALLAGFAEPAAAGRDRHADYYYPHPKTQEVYEARSIAQQDATRQSRLAFIIGFTGQQMAQSYPPRVAMFAKGDEAEKMIIVALDDDVMRTLYRARAVLAQMTAIARATPMFNDLGVADSYTFFDLAKMLGFKQITVSDGDGFAHQIILQ